MLLNHPLQAGDYIPGAKLIFVPVGSSYYVGKRFASLAPGIAQLLISVDLQADGFRSHVWIVHGGVYLCQDPRGSRYARIEGAHV